MGITIGIDIGGTFTDLVGYDRDGDRLFFTKVPSTPPELSEGFLRGIERILLMAGREARDLDRIIHGTTVSLNAILEQKGANLGILTTRGFEDILAIGRQKRSVMYDLFMDPETPTFLCPRRRISGIQERIDAQGQVLIPLDEGEVRAAATRLVEKFHVQSVAIFYLFSFLNPEHELRTAEIIREMYPALKVSLSSVVDPRFREYERLCVTAFDAYIKPVVEDYTRGLEKRLAERGVPCRLQIMQSRGGITNAGTILEKPVSTIMSGPAAGVIAGRHLGDLIDRPNLITVDIGGTSCDIALISNSKPLLSMEGRVRYYPLRQAMIDVNSIGAGGGSIAWIDSGGGLRVGPQSAGANPGPACYGSGGTEPTVTDASVILGYLNPDNFGCGEIKLVPGLAAEAVARLGARLEMDQPTTALGIHRIINSRMADEMRLVSIKRGYDPRNFALVAAGGGGPVHAGRLAEHLDIPEVIVPNAPGCLSAFGLLVADIEHEHSKTHQVRSTSVDLASMERTFAQLSEVCGRKMQEDRADPAAVRTTRFADMRYVGQSYELEVPIPEGPLTAQVVEAVAAEFHRVHDRIYGHSSPKSPVEFVNLRVVQSFSLHKPSVLAEGDDFALQGAIKGRRRALFDLAAGYVEVPVYDRRRLPVGGKFEGPAIVEQDDSTTVVYPGHRVTVDRYRNLVVRVPVKEADDEAAGAAAVGRTP